MTIKVGDKLPDVTFTVMTDEGPKPMTTAEVFGAKKQHMPGFVANSPEFKGRGIDMIACTSVNDIFVLTNWAKDTGAEGKITMLADGSADFATKLGLEIDLMARGLGVRSKRYSMIVDKGVVTVLNVEDAPPQHDKSSATSLLACSL
jgi:glutaredoxin/glutathione-dependent peroxiredoxin